MWEYSIKYLLIDPSKYLIFKPFDFDLIFYDKLNLIENK